MKKLFFTLSMLLAVGSTYAAPAKQGKKVLTLADGTQVTATLKGDEFLNWWESDNGTKYVAGEDGTYQIANFEVMKANAELRRSPIAAERAQRMSKVASAAPKKAVGPARVDIGESHITYTGKKKGVIILYEFSNTKFATGHDNDYYNMVANERNLQHADGYVGSVSDWFLAQSNGTFELDFDIYGPYTSKHTAAYYGNNDAATGRTDANVGYMIRDACDAAVADGCNFNDYDWDGDGYADQVFVLYAGLGEASGGSAETVWPHEYQVRYTKVGRPLTYDAQGKVDTYACANELELEINENTGTFTNQKKLAGIGTICHEFSHCLGFPDMYDVANNGNGTGNYGMGYFDVMCSGSYNGGGFVPCNYTAYERIYAGWTEPIVLDDPATIKNMKSANDFGRPFIMYNDKNNDEFYTFENRQPVGWDASIYGAAGLMITHVDYDQSVWGINAVNSSASDHQRCTIFHADNDDKITLDGIMGDLYPYVNPRSGVVINDELSDDSTPASTLYNKNADGSKYMGKPVTAIEQNEDGTINFLVLGGSDDNVLDNTTVSAIAGVKTDVKSADNRVYSIDGRYLGNDVDKLGRGIYIVGGKKEVKM